jgi:DNA-directed RNA polymerase subunit F
MSNDLAYHEKGAAILKKLLTACTNVENVKEALERVVKIYSYEIRILFTLSKEQLKYIDKLENVISKCCPKEYSEMKNEIMQIRTRIIDPGVFN